MEGPSRTFEEAPEINFTRRAPLMPWWFRRQTILKTLGVALVLVLVTTGAYVFAQRNKTTAVSLSSAVGQFRHESKTEQDAAPLAVSQQKVDGPGQAVAGGRAPAQAESPVARQPSHLAAVAPVPYVLPPEGVYTYRTTGGEQISLGNAHHDYPPETTATLRHLGGCRWRIENDVVKEHTDIRTFCAQTGSLFQDEQARWVTFYGKREGEDITFQPPQLMSAATDAVGTASASKGSDPQGDTAQGTRTYLGRAAITIGSTPVQALRVHLSGTSSGQSRGTFVEDFWLDPATGMTLRWERSVNSVTNAFGTQVRYTEHATFQLESLVPQT